MIITQSYVKLREIQTMDDFLEVYEGNRKSHFCYILH